MDKKYDAVFKLVLSYLMARFGQRILVDVQLIGVTRRPDLLLLDHDVKSSISPLNLAGKFAVIEFKSEKDPVKLEDIGVLITETRIVFEQYILQKQPTTLEEVTGFLFLAKSDSFKKMNLVYFRLKEIDPGVWQSLRYQFLFIIELQKMKFSEDNQMLKLFVDSDNRTKLIKEALNEYEISQHAKAIIYHARLLDKDKVEVWHKRRKLTLTQVLFLS